MAMDADRAAMNPVDSWTRTDIAATTVQVTEVHPALSDKRMSTRPRRPATRVCPGIRGTVKKGGRKNDSRAAKGIIWPLCRRNVQVS